MHKTEGEPEWESASDVYCGLTSNQLRGNYGHDTDYWYIFDTFDQNQLQKELFAEYYSYQMTDNQNSIQSTQEYFGTSCNTMEEMIDSMKP